MVAPVLAMLTSTRGPLPRGHTLDASAADTEVGRMAVAFARLLRGSGLTVPLGTVLTFAEALNVVGVAERTGVYWAGRAVLVRRPEDIAEYDRVFAAFWMGRAPNGTVTEEIVQQITLALDKEEDDEPETDDDQAEGDTIAVRFSRQEVLRDKDFAEYSTEEFAEARKVMESLRLVGSPRYNGLTRLAGPLLEQARQRIDNIHDPPEH